MKKACFFLFLILIIPIPLTQFLIEGFIPEQQDSSDESYSFQIVSNSEQSLQNQIVRIVSSSSINGQDSQQSDNNPVPKLSPATYPSFTYITANASSIQKNESVQAVATTEFELLGMFPVDHGEHYWYDLVSVLEDNEAAVGDIINTDFAIQFSLPFDTDFMSFSFNLSQITSTASNQIDFYITDNLSDYQTDYLMKNEISSHEYNFHKNNVNSPHLFVYWNHPLTSQVNNHLTAGTDYYAVLSSSNSFSLQYSNDSAGTDENSVYVLNSGWEEQAGIDMQFNVYLGSLLQNTTVSVTGQTSYVYDSTTSTNRNHRLTVAYYDVLNAYDKSSSFWEIDILDSFAPEFITLTSPPTAEYSDNIEILAKIENLYHQSLSNINVSFLISNDNLTWSYLASNLTDQNGFAIANHTINQASGMIYFKASVGLLTDYSSTDQQKEQIEVQTPRINCKYGSASGSASLTLYSLKTRIVDNEGDPVVGLLVQFFMQGLIFPIFVATNDSGWAESPIGFLDWNSGYYANSYWIVIDMDSNLYTYPSTTYGDIDISQNNLTVQTSEEIQGYWNEPLDVTLQFFDGEGDYVPFLNYEVVLYDESTTLNTSLGIFQTNSTGFGFLSFPANFFNPGQNQLFIKVSSLNYLYFEYAIPLITLNDKAIIVVNINENITYVYNSVVQVEVFVSDHFGNPIENITVLIYVSMPDLFGFWGDVYSIKSNSSGYASIDLAFILNAGEELNILITTEDYFQNSVLYYLTADPYVSYVSCVQAPSSITEISDINCSNQETIDISGRLISNNTAIKNSLITITILGESFSVYSDDNGYFNLSYFIEQGGVFEVIIGFDSSSNYVSSTESIFLNCSPCSVVIIGEDIYHTNTNPVEFVVQIQSFFGTTPSGISVLFYWFDGNSWIYLNSAPTNSSGFAKLSPSITYPSGEWLWRAEINPDADWVATADEWILKIGVDTVTSVTSPSEADYLTIIDIIAVVTDEHNQPILVEVEFYINGSYIGSSLTNTSGVAIFSWQIDFASGNYEVTAAIVQTGMYLTSSDNTKLYINKTESYLTCEDIFVYYSQVFTLSVKLYSTAGGIGGSYLTILIPGEHSELILTNLGGIALWTIPILVPGVYEVHLIFDGDEFYYSSILIVNLQINKMPTNLSLDAQNQIYTPFYLISGYLQDHLLQPMEGTLLTLQINGSFYQTALSDVFGYYEFNITLEPGTYALDIIFLGDSNYLGSNESRLVHIWKIDTVLQGVVLWQNLILIIDAYLNDSYDNPLQNMVIEFYLNGSLEGQNQTDSSGYTQFLISDVLPGVYEIEIVFRGDDIHEQSSQLIVMEQQKEQTELIVKIYEGIYATLATRIEIRLTSNNLPLENQNILLRINGQDIFGLTNSSGYVLISLDLFSDASFYNLEIFYAGDSVYSSIFYNSNFSILKAQTSIDLSFYYQNYQPWLSGLLQGPTLLSTETVTIKVNDTVYLVLITDSLGEFLTQIGLVAGNYLVTVSFDGSNNYHATSTSIEITIFKTPTQILFDGDFNQTFGLEIIIEVQLLDILWNPMQANLIISLDGNYYVTISTNILGFANITLLSGIPVDFHQITVTYQGDGFYYQSSKIIDFYTKYSIEIVDLVSLPSSYGQEGIIEGKINTFRGLLQGVDINLLINGENLLVQADSQGHFIFYLNQNLEAGAYLAQIRVDENIGILYFEFSFSIDRDKGPVDITVNPLVMVFNKVTIIGGTVAFQGDEISNALVSIHINGNNFGSIVTDIDGNFIIPTEWLQLSPGIYNLTIFVILNDLNIEDTAEEFAFEILKDNPESMIAWENNVVEEDLVLVITFIDSNGQLIPFHEFSVEINGTIISEITDGNGYCQIFYSISEGSILELVVYSEESRYYYEYRSSFNIPVEKCDSYLKLEDNEVYYNSTSGITLTLFSEKNNTIENALILVYIDQEEYIYYTNSSGQISINIMGMNVGNYSLAILFEGNLSYNFTNLEFNAEIIPQTTIITYVKEENQIVIELLDGENRSLSNKDIKVQYVDSDGNALNEETFTTNQFGRIIIVLNFKEISRKTESLKLLFEGDNLYKKYQIKVTLQDLISLSKNLLASSGALQVTLAILGTVGLVSLRHLLRRKKRFSK